MTNLRNLMLVAVSGGALMVLFALGNGLTALAPDYPSMLAFRFLAGLPHGAYFGVAALVAASLVPRERRTQAVSRVIAGLTVATVVGVPLANAVGQLVGWRWSFALVAGLATLTAVLVRLFLLDQYDDAELDRKKTAAMFAGFITKTAPEEPMLGEVEADLNGTAIASLEPGTMQVLLPGEDVKFSAPADVGGGYEAFQYRTLLAVSASLSTRRLIALPCSAISAR